MTDMVSLAVQVVSLLSTMFAAVWFLSSRLERVTLHLEKHTTVLRAQISQIESQLDELKVSVASSRSELNELRERTVRLETHQEVEHGKRA